VVAGQAGISPSLPQLLPEVAALGPFANTSNDRTFVRPISAIAAPLEQVYGHYPRRHVDIRDIDDTWQGDLVDMIAYAKVNRGHHFLLTVIDFFSNFAWTVPTKTKSGSDVNAAMRCLRARPPTSPSLRGSRQGVLQHYLQEPDGKI